MRINDRRALDWMLESFGFGLDERPGVLITIDKLDKVGHDGVIAELRERGATPEAVDAFEAFTRRPMTMEYNPFGERQIRKALPAGVPDEIIAHLVAIGDAVRGAPARRRSDATAASRWSSTRSSCAGWATTPARSSSSRTRASPTPSAAAVATTA